jgi:hypothetical protein
MDLPGLALSDQQTGAASPAGPAQYVLSAIAKLPNPEKDVAARALRTLERRLAAAAPSADSTAFAAEWPAVYEVWRRENVAAIAARNVLKSRSPTPPTPAATQFLKAKIEEWLALSADHVPGPGPSDAAEAQRERDGMYELDAAAVEFLSRIGSPGDELRKQGEKAAEWLRSQAPLWWNEVAAGGEPPWARWRDPVRWATLLGRALWTGQVAALSVAEEEKPAALSLWSLERATRLMGPGVHVVSEEASTPRVVTDRGEPLAVVQQSLTFNIPALDMDATRALGLRPDLVRSLDGQKLIRWEVVTGHRRTLERLPDPRTIQVPGAYTGLCEVLGCRSKKSADQLRRIVEAQAHLVWTAPDGSHGNMLSYYVTRATGGRRANLSLTLGEMLLPDFVFRFKGATQAMRDARKLVPITDLPPLLNPNCYHGEQATFQLHLLSAIRRRATELVEFGGVYFREEDLASMAAEAGLPTQMLARLIDCWVQGDDHTPPFLSRVDKERFTLAEGHAAARAFLEDAGRRELKGAARGRAGARKNREA